jgi:hypothetical protein
MSCNLHERQRIRTSKLTQTWMAFLLAWAGTAIADSDDQRFPILPPVPLTSSTIPANGDLNPYGLAFIPAHFRTQGGPLSPGDLLVSNFNNSANSQGTGTTIVKVAPNGQTSLFFQGNTGLGLTTALGVLKKGFVLVGNVPTTDGTCPTVQPGSILVLDADGVLVQTLSDPQLLDGPWYLTIHDEGEHATVFVSNVLNGTVARLQLAVGSASVTLENSTQIASGYLHRCDPAALVVGPTGLAYDPRRDLLYVASTGDNKIFAIMNASKIKQSHGMGGVIFQDQAHLHGPLALVLAPTGHLLTSNGDAVNPDPKQPSEVVEFTPGGKFIAQLSLDPAPGGAFGLALTTEGDDVLRFAAVDDNANNVSVWTLHVPDSER